MLDESKGRGDEEVAGMIVCGEYGGTHEMIHEDLDSVHRTPTWKQHFLRVTQLRAWESCWAEKHGKQVPNLRGGEAQQSEQQTNTRPVGKENLQGKVSLLFMETLHLPPGVNDKTAEQRKRSGSILESALSTPRKAAAPGYVCSQLSSCSTCTHAAH